MKKSLIAVALLCAAETAAAEETLAAAQDAAAIAKARAERLTYELQAANAQRALAEADAKAAADAAKLASEQAHTAKKNALELEKGEQELADKQQAALAGASKGLADLAASAGVKDISVTGTPIEAKTLAYRALEPIAARLAAELVSTAKAGRYVLAENITLDSLLAAQTAEHSLARLAGKYEAGVNDIAQWFGEIRDGSEPKTKSAGAVALGLEGIKALASVVQTFHTRFSVTAHDVAIDQAALHAALARAWCASPDLKDAKLTVYSGLSLALTDTDLGKSVRRLEDAQDVGAAAEAEMTAWLAINKTDAATPAAAKPAAKAKATAPKPAPRAVVDRVQQELAKLKAANTRVSDVLTALASTPAGQTASPLTQLLRSGHVLRDLRKGAHLLSVKAVAAGGNSLATNNLWRGPKLYHSGGAVVSYTVIDQHGDVVGGSVLDSHTGYVRLERAGSSKLGNSWDEKTPAKATTPKACH